MITRNGTHPPSRLTASPPKPALTSISTPAAFGPVSAHARRGPPVSIVARDAISARRNPFPGRNPNKVDLHFAAFTLPLSRCSIAPQLQQRRNPPPNVPLYAPRWRPDDPCDLIEPGNLEGAIFAKLYILCQIRLNPINVPAGASFQIIEGLKRWHFRGDLSGFEHLSDRKAPLL